MPRPRAGAGRGLGLAPGRAARTASEPYARGGLPGRCHRHLAEHAVPTGTRPGAGALREGRAGHGPASPRPPRSRPGTVAVRRTDRPRPVSTVAVRVKGTRPRTDGLEQAVAHVVARPGCGEAKVRRAVNYAIRGGLAAYKRPARLEFRDELPTTSTGKLAACELRKASAQQRPGTSRAPPPSPTSVPAPRRYSPRCARTRRAAGLCERSPPTGTGPAWPTRWTTGPRAVVTSRGAHRPAFHRGPSGSR
ncbi:AMP-binding enzyme [Streptomyces diastaticus]